MFGMSSIRAYSGEVVDLVTTSIFPGTLVSDDQRCGADRSVSDLVVLNGFVTDLRYRCHGVKYTLISVDTSNAEGRRNVWLDWAAQARYSLCGVSCSFAEVLNE